MNRDPQELFDETYFATGCGRPYRRDEEWLSFFAGIAEKIMADIQPGNVLDAGCAMGFLVEGLRNLGVEAYGIDLSEYAIDRVHTTIKNYCWQGSIVDPLPQKYDLITCIEVLEHIHPEHAEAAVSNLCAHTDDVLFSSTPFDFKEVTHFNVQPPEYWSELFAKQNFFRDIDYEATYITEWAVRYRKVNEPLHRHIRNYERKFWLLWKENRDLRNLVNDARRVQSSRADHSHNETDEDPIKSNIPGFPPVDELDLSVDENLHNTITHQKLLADKLAELENVVEMWEKRWADYENSPGGRLLNFMHKLRVTLAPDGSLRGSLLRRLFKSG